ncbi:MAG TPA: hypothetical protein VK908_17285 [Jiangellales bacterium]|nr:hypothetical protein [Jiangellales bacterium]
MKHSRRLAVAGAVAATMLSGTLVLAMPAVAVPDSGGSEASGSSTSQVQLRRSAPNESGLKAQIERQEQAQQPLPAPKAQLERQELQPQPKPAQPASTSSPASDEFPWAIAGLSLLGVAAAGAVGVAIGRHSRHVPAQA